jgi:hypothetical protein
MGRGLLRKRRMFHPDDLAAFVERQRRTDQCQSTNRRTRTGARRRSMSMTSSTNVVGFTAILNAEHKQKPAR